jgi:hypothetical protein
METQVFHFPKFDWLYVLMNFHYINKPNNNSQQFNLSEINFDPSITKKS